MIITEGKIYKTRDGRKAGPMLDRYGIWFTIVSEDASLDGRCWRCDGRHDFGETNLDLIAEWPDEPIGPVRTEIRKVIVPGTYGIVTVGKQTAMNEVWVDLEGYRSAEQLRETSDTFLALADALESNK